MMNGCISLNFLYNLLFSLAYQIIPSYDESDWTDITVSVIFAIIAIVSFNYLIQFNAYMAVLRTELIFVTKCTKRAITLRKDISVQTEIYFELLSIMALLVKVHSMPIMFSIMLVFYESTAQSFQIYHIISSSNGDERSVMDVISYAVWLWPMILMLVSTMVLAGNTSKQVSYVAFLDSVDCQKYYQQKSRRRSSYSYNNYSYFM